jgi:hypothetical protein
MSTAAGVCPTLASHPATTTTVAVRLRGQVAQAYAEFSRGTRT